MHRKCKLSEDAAAAIAAPYGSAASARGIRLLEIIIFIGIAVFIAVRCVRDWRQAP